MTVVRASNGVLSVLFLATALLAGCGSKVALRSAPVEDRGMGGARIVAAPGETGALAPKPLPGAENAGKPGYYTVKPGDTLIRIGLDTGQNWRDIGRWNKLDNPNQIEVGQVLQVVPTHLLASASAVESGVVTRPVASVSVAPVQPGAAPTPARAASAAAPVTAETGSGSEEELAWIWPAAGSVIKGFDEATKNGGLDLGGKAGDPVLAAMDGQVWVVGVLRGYGNLIVIKHNNTYISAYAHNQTMLVKENQMVKKGQKIAEMGNSDAERVMLHFEIRRLGKPVDPAKLLPAR